MQKRTAAGLNTKIKRPVKKRASKACQYCRIRKVRCNVVENGSPCTNCKMDDVDCVITQSKRRNKVDTDLDGEFPTASSSSLSPISPIHAQKVTALKTKKLEQHVPHLIYQRQSRRLESQERNRASLGASGRPLLPLLHTNSPSSTRVDPSCSPNICLNRRQSAYLPSYLKPLPPALASEDVEYLETKGALSTPATELRNELLQRYVEYVHGYLPLLQLQDFLGAIDGKGSYGQISIMLYQAVMFAGTAYVDERHLRSAGYETRKVAQKAFYQKVKLLYDFDIEKDRLVLVQALLLMSLWDGTAGNEKDLWHWMGIAINLAHTIGLPQNPETSQMSIEKQRLRKRIWWSCVMQDRLVALEMRRPARIHDGDYDVPMLTVADFELEAVDDNITCIPSDCIFAKSIELQRQMAILCVEKANLCLCVGHVFSTQYSVVNKEQVTRTKGDNTGATMMLVPKNLESSDDNFRFCDAELTQWYEGLPNEAMCRAANSIDLATGNSPLIVHQALLYMVYHTTVCALHQPQVVAGNPSIVLNPQERSRYKVRHAASETTAMASCLQTQNLARYLPTMGVTALFSALMTHTQDTESYDAAIRAESIEAYATCRAIIQSLCATHASAEFAMDFLRMTMQRHPDIKSRLGSSSHHSDLARFQPAIDQHVALIPTAAVLTPPPDECPDAVFVQDDDVAWSLQRFLATNSPPASEGNEFSRDVLHSEEGGFVAEVVDFESLIDLDPTAENSCSF